MHRSLVRGAAAILAPLAAATAQSAAPIEFGTVAWARDFEAAATRARARRVPLLVLFQEQPGWATCRNYGAHVLSDPLLVEAIETLFEPVAIRNNSDGDADARVREAFAEPAWNNPVVRIVDADRSDLAPRLHDDWSAAALVDAMVAARTARELAVPAWLRLVQEEEQSRRRGLERAVFAMGDKAEAGWFWNGEAEFGLFDGARTTTAGWFEGHEVVDVRFDPTVMPFADLLARARRKDCAHIVWTDDAAARAAARVEPDREPKYRLRGTRWRHVPMTPLQALRANAAAARKDDDGIRALLSPRQVALERRIAAAPDLAWPVVVDLPLPEAWSQVDAVAAKASGR